MSGRRLIVATIMWMVMVVVFASCSRKQPAGKHPESGLRAAVVTDVGGINDMSFNANAWIGLQRAQKELGIRAKFVESKEQADYETNLRELAESGYDLIFAVGFLMKEATEKVAPDYPKVKFALIDAETKPLPNVVSLIFREQEGAYLVGAMAGLMTKSGTVGFIGGMEVPVIKRFEAGYKAGMKTVRPDGKVLVKYTNNWVDIAAGKEMAIAEFNQGADIIFHASGRCGIGVINAAKERGPGYYAIGVDADQDYLGCADPKNPKAPSRVLTSMLKRVDNAVFDVCKQVVDRKFTAGTIVFGIKENGIGISPMKYSRQDISADKLAEVAALQELIAEGKLKPPADDKQLEKFVPPVL